MGCVVGCWSIRHLIHVLSAIIPVSVCVSAPPPPSQPPHQPCMIPPSESTNSLIGVRQAGELPAQKHDTTRHNHQMRHPPLYNQPIHQMGTHEDRRRQTKGSK